MWRWMKVNEYEWLYTYYHSKIYELFLFRISNASQIDMLHFVSITNKILTWVDFLRFYIFLTNGRSNSISLHLLKIHLFKYPLGYIWFWRSSSALQYKLHLYMSREGLAIMGLSFILWAKSLCRGWVGNFMIYSKICTSSNMSHITLT